MPKLELTRRTIYDLVWSKPMTKVAQDLGISDVALKKICDKHRVPTPPRGHWAKKATGKPTRQIQLHITADPQHEYVVIYGSRNELPLPVREVLNLERERRKALRRTVPPDGIAPTAPVQDLHPVIAATARTLRKAKPKSNEPAKAQGPGYCGIEVRSSSVERTIAILDTIVRALDVRGLGVEAAGDCIRVTLTPDHLNFSLIERVQKQNHLPTVEELAHEERRLKKRERDARMGVWSFGQGRAYPEFDFIRTGELSIQIADKYIRGLRRNWSDGKRQKLEGLADDVVAGIAAYLAGVRVDREERERWRRDWERQQRLAALARARDEREIRRLEFLKRFLTISAEAAQLKSFLVQLSGDLTENPSGEIARLLAWTEARLLQLQDELRPKSIGSALCQAGLFPEVDELSLPDTDDSLA